MQQTSSQSILLLYSSRFGQCQRIAQMMAQQLSPLGYDCQVLNIEQMPPLPQPVENYASVIIVASIRYGFFHKKVGQFVKENLTNFQNILDVFIPVNLIARNPERRTLERNNYARKFLEKTSWKPKLVSIMAGALRYPVYNFFDRFMIRLIMKMTKGETDPTKEIEYTDWDDVRQFALQIDQQLRTPQTPKAHDL